jgi:branched-chain amino acid transport system substrate-binding protein
MSSFENSSDAGGISRRSFTAISAAIGVGWGLSACSRLPDVVKIGVAQPLSGGLAALGKDMLQGVQLAAAELEKAGYKVDGKPVKFEIVAVDDQAKPDVGKQVAQQLVDQGVVAVIGHLNSGVSIPAAEIYNTKGIAQLAISTNPKFTQLGFAGTLRLVANDDLQARAVGGFGSTLAGERYGVVDDATVYGKGLAEAAAAQLKNAKKQVALRQSFNDTTKDFAGLADKIKADGIQILVSTLNDFQVIALIDSLEKNGYAKSLTIMGTDTLKTGAMVAQAARVGSMYCTSSVLEASEFPAGAQFLAAYQAAYKAAPAYGGHYSYDAMYVIAAAIRRAQSVDPQAILKAMRTMDPYGPVTGSMKWTPSGELKYGVVSVYTVRAGRWESVVRSDTW